MRERWKRLLCAALGHPCRPTGREGILLREWKCSRCGGVFISHKDHGPQLVRYHPSFEVVLKAARLCSWAAVLMVCGCSQGRTAAYSESAPYRAPAAASRPAAAVAVVSRLQTVTLTWSNAPSEQADLFYTAIEATTDLVQWAEVARLPYAVSNAVVLSNRPAGWEFYRAKNGVKGL